MNKFKGIFPALLTPFNSSDEINEIELRKLVKYNINKGITGFYVGGSTAEAFLLSADERKRIYEIVKDEADGKCTLIAHVGSVSTKEAVGFAEKAQSLGYNAISAVAPFYYKFSFEEIKNYYFDIAQSVDVPMIVYNIPAFSGVSMSADNINEFLKSDKFLGVKHTSNDFFALERIKNNYPDKIVYNGYDEMYLSGLSMGADGGIGSTYNFMAEKFIEITRLFNEGKLDEARRVQNIANSIITSLIKVGVMQGEKEVLCRLGFDFGCCRKPFAPLTDEQKEIINKEILPLL